MKKLLFISAFALLASCTTDWDAENGFDGKGADSGNTLDSIDGIDESMYAEAKVFPGLVDTARETHIDTTIVLNLSYPYHSASDLGLIAQYKGQGMSGENIPQPIYSTGVYAGAGELVTITLPEGNNYGLTAQIGMQTDDLSDVGSYLRKPIAYTRKSLYPGRNQMRFPLGGYIWIIRDHNAVNSSELPIHISGGVYAAPDYVYGKTDPQTWERKVRSTTVPWMDIRGNRVTFSVNRERIVEMMNSNRNFAAELDYCLNFWDKMAEYRYKQLGLAIGASDAKDRMPDFHDRFIFDVQLRYNTSSKAYDMMHTQNDQGIMLIQTSAFYNQMLSWKNIRQMDVNDIYSAITYKYRFINPSTYFTFSDAENYIPMYRASQYYYLNNINDSLNGMGLNLSEYVPKLLKYAEADSAKNFYNDNWCSKHTSQAGTSAKLLLLTQLNEYGKKFHKEGEWEFYNEMNRNARHEKRYDTSFFSLLCEHYATNFAPLFERLGFTLNDKERADGEKYPLLRDEVWKINPLLRNSTDGIGTWNGKWHYRVDRREWKALATSKAKYGSANEDTDNKMTVANLFDNSLGTYWRNALKKNDANIELPYYIIIDMKKAQTVNGVYFANGWDWCVSQFHVQVLDATSDMELDDTENADWHDWGTVEQTRANCLHNERFVEFGSARTTRYLRLVFDKENLYTRPDETLKPTDAATFDKQHKSRYQRLAEFGVWHY